MHTNKKNREGEKLSRIVGEHIRRMKSFMAYDYSQIRPVWEHQLESLRQMQGKRG